MLRRFRVPPVSLSIATLVLAGAVACSAELASPSADTPAGALNGDNSTGSSSGGSKPIATDAATSAVAPYHGNPLCHTATDTCMPDDDVTESSAAKHSLCTAIEDPAMTSGDAAPAPNKSCRVERADGGAPVCDPETTLSAGDGTKCERGSDCAPGFDCIAGDKGAKACRHYCCSGSCKANLSNGSATFCDVQPLVDVPQKAPFCMPLKHCSTILGTGECASSETCTVVTEDGDTGCVAVGDKLVGESCDESHCAAGLVCLGQPGSRECYKLCKVNGTDCPSAQTCVTSAAFKDADFGICGP